MEEVSTGLKVSLLVFALLMTATLGVMVVKSDDMVGGLNYAAYE